MPENTEHATASAEPERLDPRGVRFTAAITSVILALGLLTGSWRLLAAQAVLFAVCAFVGFRFNPWGQLFRGAVRPRLARRAPDEREPVEPVRFAQKLGFVCTLVATVGYAADLPAVGISANVLALGAALLNAVFGYCLGCRVYPLLRRLTGQPASEVR